MNRNTRSIDVNAGPARGGARSFAQVFDTYQAPAQSRSGMHSLGKALGLVGESFQSAEIRRRNEEKIKQEEADRRRGIIDGLTGSMSHDPAKIKSGEMQPQQSQAYMAGLQESQAEAAAHQFAQEISSSYDAWSGKNSNDPAVFQEWLAGKIDAARKSIGNSDYAIAGSLPVIQMTINNMNAKHTAYTSKRLKDEDITSMQTVSLSLMEGQDWENDPTGASLISSLAFQADIRVARGLDGGVINQTMVDDVMAFADAHNDTRYLAALAAAHDAGDYRLSAAQMKQVDDMRLNIESELDAVAADNAAALKKEQTEAENAALKAYQAELFENPLVMPSKELPPEVYKTALSLRSSYNQAKDYVSPQAEAASFAVLNAVIYDPEFQKLPYSEKLSQIAPMLADPSMNLSEGSIAGVFRVLGAKSDPKSIFNNPTDICRAPAGALQISMEALGFDDNSFGAKKQLATAFQSEFDNLAIAAGDIEGKTALEIKQLHDDIVGQVMQGLLSNPETRATLQSTLVDSPALAEQFGLQGYLDAQADAEQAKAEEELAAITGG